MKKINLINKLNQYAFDNSKTGAIDELNTLFASGEYKDCFDLICAAISSTQLYGFLEYFSEEEKQEFYSNDLYRTMAYRGNQIPFYNCGQLSFLNELEVYKKVFFSAPTSFGKTSMVIEFILNNYRLFKNILFVIPTNSLLEELFVKLSEYNKQLKMNYHISTQPSFFPDRNNLLIVTPERFLLMYEETDMKRFDLIIMDETYKIVDSRNEMVSDFIECRALRFRRVADMIAKNDRVIFLSPFTYELTESMKDFLNKYDIEKIDRTMEYVKREIIDLSNSFEYKKVFKTESSGFREKLSIKEKTAKILSELNKEQSIVYVGQYNKAYEIVDEIKGKNESLDKRYLAFLRHLKETYSVDYNKQWKVIDGLEKGIGIYISPMPRYIKKEIIRLFEQNILNTLIVTTSFTEGVNTNAKNLIFTSTINGPNKNKLSNIDILNVAGRAGRFAKSSVGKVYCTSAEIYNTISKLQEDSQIRLENYNYFKTDYSKNDYEIEMVDDEYLSDEDIKEKNKIYHELELVGLNKSDLNISLNVSNKWKIHLYKKLCNIDENQIYKLNSNIRNLFSKDPSNRVDSLEYLFNFVNDAFSNSDIELFSEQPYDIKAFDKKNDFIWGRLYKIYASGPIKSVINKNMIYIMDVYENTMSNYNHEKKIKEHFADNGKAWILKYYSDEGKKLNFNALYSETFKFISYIVQYKIPFYTAFIVSIFKLFIKKHSKFSINIDDLDVKKISLLFENGEVNQNWERLIDFGISNDLIMKLEKNKITVEQVKSNDYDHSIFDDYEKIILQDFVDFDK